MLYGSVESVSESAVTTLFSDVVASDVACQVNNVQLRYPTHCDDVAAVIRQLIDRRSQVSASTEHFSSYRDRLANLDLQTLERRRLVYDLVFCYKILHGLCDVSLPVELSCSNTRGNNLKLAKHFCYNDVR